MTRAYWSALAAFAAVVIILTLGVVTYFNFKPAPAPPGTHLPATPAPELKKETTVPVQVAGPVQVYKPAAKAKLKLSPEVQDDPNQHVVASTRTANDDRQHTVTTTLDTSTGRFTTVDRAEPPPWLAVSTRQHYGAYIGALNGEQAIAITARQEVLRVRGMKVEGIAIGAMSQDERFAFVGVGASW
jgi:hypothetical protein